MRWIVLLALPIAIWGCSESRPPAVGGGGGGSVGGGNMDAGNDGGAGADGGGGSGGAPDGGAPPGVSCSLISAAGNSLTVNTTASISFDADVAFATWTPDVCSPVRSLSVGFDTDACGFDDGELLTFVIDEDDIGVGVIAGTPVVITLGSAVTVRLRANDGVAVREWGNCIGSSGTLTFTAIDPLPSGNIQMNFNVTATDCGGAGQPNVTLIGSLSVTAPEACPEQ